MINFHPIYRRETDNGMEFMGPSPVYLDTWSIADMAQIYKQPWYIEHAEITPQQWKLLDLFGMQLRRIHVGKPIYIIATPLKDKDAEQTGKP